MWFQTATYWGTEVWYPRDVSNVGPRYTRRYTVTVSASVDVLLRIAVGFIVWYTVLVRFRVRIEVGKEHVEPPVEPRVAAGPFGAAPFAERLPEAHVDLFRGVVLACKGKEFIKEIKLILHNRRHVFNLFIL